MVGRVRGRGPFVTEKRRMEEEVALAAEEATEKLRVRVSHTSLPVPKVSTGRRVVFVLAVSFFSRGSSSSR